MARPKPGNYAIYTEAGKKRYEAALRKYLANKKKAEDARKITSTKKNIEKQKTANKKAGTTTGTKTVSKTKATPKTTAAKGKTLATGKTTSKTKAVETPKTKTATKTRTRTRTQTKSKTTTKTTPKSKTVTKPVTKSKTTPKTTGKTSKNLKIKKDRYVRRGQFPKDKNYGNPVKKYQRTVVRPPEGKNYGKPLSEKGKSTNTTGSTVKGKIKQGIDSGVKKGKEVASQVKQSGKKFSDILKVGNKQKNPKATTGPQKVFQAINQTGRKVSVLSKKYLKKNKPLKTAAGKVITGVKNNPGSVVRGAKNIVKGGIYGGLAEAGLRRLTKPITNRITKGVRNYIRKTEYGDKPLTLEESNALTKKVNNMSGAERKAYLKKQKEQRKEYRQSKNTNTSNQSSTTKNINKQKTVNKQKVTNPNAEKLKIAKKRVRNAKGYNKEKLQREVRYLEKFGKQGRTWSNPVGAEGNNKPSSVKVDKTSSGRKMHAIEKRNRERFGDAHVDKLKADHAKWKKRRKKK